jgi:DNA-binding LytR/AlgR family response regulator
VRPLKAVIAEDEPVLRSELRDTLAKLWPELEICAEAEDGIAALREIAAHAPDILFLDIQMPGCPASRSPSTRAASATSRSSPPTTSTRSPRSSRARSTT